MTAIIQSFFRLPFWVKIWVFFILVPVNMGGLFFLDHPVGRWCAILGIVGMMPNLVIMWMQKGLSKAMAFPHLVPWTILVIWLVTLLNSPEMPSGNLLLFIGVLLLTDIISLVFDYRDAWLWWKGDRDVA